MTDNGSSRIITPGQHRTVADLSSRDRSALMDETLMTVHELLLQVATLAKQTSDTGQAVLALKREKDALAAVVKAHAAVCAERWDDNSARHAFIDGQHHAFVGRPFLARLRWLLIGR